MCYEQCLQIINYSKAESAYYSYTTAPWNVSIIIMEVSSFLSLFSSIIVEIPDGFGTFPAFWLGLSMLLTLQVPFVFSA